MKIRSHLGWVQLNDRRIILQKIKKINKQEKKTLTGLIPTICKNWNLIFLFCSSVFFSVPSNFLSQNDTSINYSFQLFPHYFCNSTVVFYVVLGIRNLTDRLTNYNWLTERPSRTYQIIDAMSKKSTHLFLPRSTWSEKRDPTVLLATTINLTITF